MEEIEFDADCEGKGEEITEVTATDTVTTEVEAEQTKRNRFKSWALWLSILGAISVVFTALGVWDKIGISSDVFEAIVTAIGSILTAFGIVNNPTDSSNF